MAVSTTGKMFVQPLLRLGKNLLWGMAWGSGMGAGFCLIGIALVAIRGPRLLQVYNITLGTLMLTYLVGGLGAGAIMGLARPLLRWRAGAIAVGIVGGTIAYGAVGIAMSGPISRWESSDWILAVLLGLIAGTWLGNSFWEKYVEPTLPPPELPPGPSPPRPPLGRWRPR
jgi:hypothetical protein